MIGYGSTGSHSSEPVADWMAPPDGSTNDNRFEKIVGFPKRQRYHGFPTYPDRWPGLPVAKGPDRWGWMGTNGDGWGGNRWDLMGYSGTLGNSGGEGTSGEGITIRFESEKHLFENDCGHKKNTHLMKASVPEL